MADIANMDAVKERILQDATRLFLQHGYKRTTMDDIASAVGISKGSVYLHFQCKEDIFRTACLRVVEQVLQRMRQVAHGPLPGDEKLRRVYYEAMLHVWDFTHQAPHAPDLWGEVLEKVSKEAEPGIEAGRGLLETIVSQGQREGTMDTALNPQEVARLIQLAMQGFDAPYFLIRRREQIEQDLPRLMELIVRGLRPMAPQTKDAETV